MEVTAALEAVRALEGPLRVMSDSTYVVNCFQQRWYEGWRKRGWLNAAKKPVANRELWEPLVDLVLARGDVEFRWVKGHAGDPMNDLVDRLAVEAARTQEGRSGDEPPTEVGEADVPDGADPRVPEGHRLVVAGHRPPELGGYDDNEIARDVRDRIAEILSAKQSMFGDLVVLTGLGLGAEQLGAEAAARVGVPYVAVLPYPDAESMWPPASKARFKELVDGAASTVLLQRRKPPTKQAAGAALVRRDAWLARAADEAVLVWDGENPMIGKLAKTLETHLGDEVWVVRPAELPHAGHMGG
jgi:hypothetical protein